MPHLSVIICTRNPRGDYLQRVLLALDRQTLPKEQWELLLVDNGSNEPLETRWDLDWHPRARHVREDMAGLTPARLRGITESRGDLLVFVDDDNVLGPGFLETAMSIWAENSYLGAFGPGTLEPEFEVEPLPEITPLVSMLALRTVTARQWSSNPKDTDTIPWGAGLCVTQRVAEYYPQLLDRLDINTFLDRREEHLFAGGDDLFAVASVASGLGFGLFPELRVTHLISKGRLTRSYFLRLIQDHAFSHAILRLLLYGVHPNRLGIGQLKHFIVLLVKNGLFAARCQWARDLGEERASRLEAKKGLGRIDWRQG